MAHKMVSTMGAFYDVSGKFISSEVIEHGNFPFKQYTAVFQYERGEARFDGKRWAFCVEDETADMAIEGSC